MNALEYAVPLVGYSAPSRQTNRAISDHVRGLLACLGFQVEEWTYRDEAGVEKVSLVAKRGTGTGGFAYFCHTDTVPADRWTGPGGNPNVGVVADGRLYGRGSCDMRGSLAAMLAAVEQIPQSELRGPVYVVCTADEEIGSGGAKQIAQQSPLFAEMAAHQTPGVIGEPTMLDVVHAHKGICGFRAVSRGRAAHSSLRTGLNANLAMIPFLQEMKVIHDEIERDPAWQHPAFDPPTLSWNIGINDHQPAINITAERSVCTVSFRPMPGQNVQPLFDRAEAAAKYYGLEWTVLWQGSPLYVDPQSEFVQAMLQLADRSSSRTVSYGTDGVMLTALKQLIVCGPGDIAQAHTVDEWISLDQLERGTALYARMIRHWCG